MKLNIFFSVGFIFHVKITFVLKLSTSNKISLVPLWAETRCTTKAHSSFFDSVRFQNPNFILVLYVDTGQFQIWLGVTICMQMFPPSNWDVLFYAYFVAKMLKITITRFGGQVQLTKYDGGQVRGL